MAVPLRLSFEAAGPADAEAISALSRDIWQRHYRPAILTQAELEFFWQRAYTPARLRLDMDAGASYEWIVADGRQAGFLAYTPGAEPGRLRLSKLYLDPAWHGRGIGAAALRRVQQAAAARGLAEIYLYVFCQNERAIRAYRRAGFVIERTEITECGDGYRYDDYRMVYRLGAAAGEQSGCGRPETPG